MKHTKEQFQSSLDYLRKFRGCQVVAKISSVSRSGMSRRIQFYCIKDNNLVYLTGTIAVILDAPHNDNGILVKGCGMDMIFHTLSNLNYEMARLDTGKNITELLQTKECGERIYDKYFFDANNYRYV